jgi:3-deoxy-D-manno-octulosonic-acid transferase
VRADRVRVTGDTRYDQVWRRARAVDLTGPLLAPLVTAPSARARTARAASAGGVASGERFTLVAGSTWPSDEQVLLEAWQTVRRQNPQARLVLAPHEPTPAHLARIESWAQAQRASLARLGAIEVGEATADVDLVLVDRVGVLAELYAVGDAAFVGGGFHAAGLHSVLDRPPARCRWPSVRSTRAAAMPGCSWPPARPRRSRAPARSPNCCDAG